MDIRTNPQGTQATENIPEGNRRNMQAWFIVGGILWVIALILMAAGSYETRSYCVAQGAETLKMFSCPYPGELNSSLAVQAIPFPQWIQAVLMLPSIINDVLPAIITVVVVVIIMALLRWFRQALFLALTVIIGNGVNILLGDLVGRPRPTIHDCLNGQCIHYTKAYIFNSFPSGHVEYVTVFYGFLLYLTFTKPVREWRYRWLVLLLQIWSVFNLVSIGFSRVWEGEHWLTDVLASHLNGLIWLTAGIFLYRWATRKLAERRTKKLAE